MTENLPNMIKNINLHGSAAQFQEETKIFAHRQIMVRLLKIKHQGKFLKTIRKIGHIQGNPHKIYIWLVIRKKGGDFPGSPVVKNLPANAGSVALILGPGRFHMLRGN